MWACLSLRKACLDLGHFAVRATAPDTNGMKEAMQDTGIRLKQLVKEGSSTMITQGYSCWPPPATERMRKAMLNGLQDEAQVGRP